MSTVNATATTLDRPHPIRALIAGHAGMLADRGRHRAASVPDLIIAAIAELSGLTVLHPDKDFDLIAGVYRKGLWNAFAPDPALTRRYQHPTPAHDGSFLHRR